MKKVFAGLTVCLLLGVATAGDEATKKELKKFKGTWSVVSVTENGKKPPEEKTKDVQFTFDGDKITVKHGDKSEEGTFKVDPSKSPAHIDVTIKGKTHAGLYKFKDKELTICAAEGDEEAKRPLDFTPTSDMSLITRSLWQDGQATVVGPPMNFSNSAPHSRQLYS